MQCLSIGMRAVAWDFDPLYKISIAHPWCGSKSHCIQLHRIFDEAHALVRISKLSQVRMFLVVTSQNKFFGLLSQVRIVFWPVVTSQNSFYRLLSQVRIVFIDSCHKSE